MPLGTPGPSRLHPSRQPCGRSLLPGFSWLRLKQTPPRPLSFHLLPPGSSPPLRSEGKLFSASGGRITISIISLHERPWEVHTSIYDTAKSLKAAVMAHCASKGLTGVGLPSSCILAAGCSITILFHDVSFRSRRKTSSCGSSRGAQAQATPWRCVVWQWTVEQGDPALKLPDKGLISSLSTPCYSCSLPTSLGSAGCSMALPCSSATCRPKSSWWPPPRPPLLLLPRNVMSTSESTALLPDCRCPTPSRLPHLQDPQTGQLRRDPDRPGPSVAALLLHRPRSHKQDMTGEELDPMGLPAQPCPPTAV